MGLARPALGLGVFNLLALGAKLRHNPAQKRGGVVQITQGLDKAFIVQAKPGKLLDHFHIAHLFDGFVVTVPQKVHDRVFLAGGLFADYNFVAFFPFSHKLWNHLHRVLEVRADGNGAVPCGMDHTVIGAVELTKVLAVKNGFDLGVLRADVRNDPAGTILAFIINKKDLIVIIRAVLPNLIPHRLIDGAGVLLLVIGRDHNRDNFFLLAHAGFIPLSLVFGPLPQ